MGWGPEHVHSGRSLSSKRRLSAFFVVCHKLLLSSGTRQGELVRNLLIWYSLPGNTVRACRGDGFIFFISSKSGSGTGFLSSCLAVVTLALALSTANSSALGDDQYFVTIGTAGVTGVYYPSGGATCRIVNLDRHDHGVRCSAETTLGSISNIDQLREGNLDFGYVQSDWAHHAYHGSSIFASSVPFDDLRTVFSLHPEVATVVVKRSSGYEKFDDLKGARINVGSSGSGSAASWSAIIRRIGWTDEDQGNLSNLKTSQLADALCSDTIDAYFVLIGHPAALIEETQQQCGVRLLGIESSAVDAILQQSPYYRRADIPADTYGNDTAIESFGVVATFMTSAKMPDEIVGTLVKAVYENFEGFKELHPALGALSSGDMTDFGAAAPLHPGALRFFQEQGLLP